MTLLRGIFYLGPLIFGVGFMAPLIDQSLQALHWSAPFGISTLAFGLAIGAGFGTLATVRGRWL